MKKTEYFGLILLVVGFFSIFFGVWQKDLLCEPFMNRDADDRIGFYAGLKENGYHRVWDFPFTINVWLFPDMTAGQMYDTCDYMICGGGAIIAVGAFLLNEQTVVVYTKAKRKLKREI